MYRSKSLTWGKLFLLPSKGGGLIEGSFEWMMSTMPASLRNLVGVALAFVIHTILATYNIVLSLTKLCMFVLIAEI